MAERYTVLILAPWCIGILRTESHTNTPVPFSLKKEGKVAYNIGMHDWSVLSRWAAFHLPDQDMYAALDLSQN